MAVISTVMGKVKKKEEFALCVRFEILKQMHDT